MKKVSGLLCLLALSLAACSPTPPPAGGGSSAKSLSGGAGLAAMSYLSGAEARAVSYYDVVYKKGIGVQEIIVTPKNAALAENSTLYYSIAPAFLIDSIKEDGVHPIMLSYSMLRNQRELNSMNSLSSPWTFTINNGGHISLNSSPLSRSESIPKGTYFNMPWWLRDKAIINATYADAEEFYLILYFFGVDEQGRGFSEVINVGDDEILETFKFRAQ